MTASVGRRVSARALALTLAGSIAGCASAVPLPPRGAPPLVVLQRYLDALVAGDCGTVSALTASGGTGLCGAVRVSGYTDPEVLPAPDSGVWFETILTVSGGDGSLPGGDSLWHYWLGRQPDGAWRVTGEGNG